MDGSNNSAEMSMFMHFNWNNFVDNVTLKDLFIFSWGGFQYSDQSLNAQVIYITPSRHVMMLYILV